MTFNSDEVNFLVYRYLEESGFHHSAYMFGHESAVVNAGIDTTLVPRGALMSLLQKGMLFAEAEVLSLVTNNAEGADMEQKFEKTIGSMSLIESTMVESVRQKVMERRIREDLSSRTCSPHPGTSTSTANPTPQPPSAADSCSAPVNNNGPSAATSVTAASATHPHQHHIAANSSSQPPQLHKTGTSLPAAAPQLPASSNFAADRISPMIPNHANSSTPSIINPCYRSTQQRERDFRSQQSTPLATTASSSGNNSAASFTVGLPPHSTTARHPDKLPPRGVYRATGQSLELSHRMSGQAANSATAQHGQLHQGVAQLSGSATLRGATQQLPQCHGQQAPSMGHDNLNTGSMGNGMHIQPAALAQAPHHHGGALGIAKTADRAAELLIEGMHQHPQRLLSSNGNYQQLSAVGQNSAIISSGQKKATVRLDGVVGGKGGAAQPNNGNNSGSVFNAPYYK